MMGLDISYYSNAKRLRDQSEDGDYDFENGEFDIYVNPAFPRQADGLTGGIYLADDGDGFRAGSYGSYNGWRRELAKIAGHASVEAVWARFEPNGPTEDANQSINDAFVELINFSDCEGVIGPRTSAKLANDFARYQDAADVHPDDYFSSRYALWRKAFETAAHSGLVDFH